MPRSALTRSLLVGSGLLCLACAGVGFAPPEWRGGWSLVRWRGAIAGVGSASALVFTLSLIAERRRRSSELLGAWSDLQLQVDGVTGDQWDAACLAAMAPPAIDRTESERTFDAPLIEFRPAETATIDAPAPVLAEPAKEVDAAWLARLAALEQDAAGAATRAQSAEEALRHVEDARRDAQGQHVAEVARLEAEIARIREESDAERRALRRRADDAEEAVRTALRELGVDPADWPLTAEGVVRAAGPLTLHALGEGTPGWRAEAPDDTLAAAVLDLARLSLAYRPRTAAVTAVAARRPSV